MDSLDAIAIRHQTDKASQFSRTYAKPHDYCRHLDLFFSPVRLHPIKLLEIGVGGGESIQTWLEYFPRAQIFGVDLVHDTNPWNTEGARPHEAYTFRNGNQTDAAFWGGFIETCGEFDVIIDDGSHNSADILATYNFLWPHVRPGGLYEVEDLKVAPEAERILRSLIDQIQAGAGDLDSIYFARELAILRKR